MMTETGAAIMKSAPVLARSEAGNQYVKKSSMPGNSPASAMPRITRAAMKPVPLRTNMVAIETTPQPIMIRAIHRRAPTRSMIRLLGTSNRQ